MKDLLKEVGVEVLKRGTKSLLVSVGGAFVLGFISTQLNELLGEEEENV